MTLRYGQLDAFRAEREHRRKRARAGPVFGLLDGGQLEPEPPRPMTAVEIHEGLQDVGRRYLRMDDDGRRAVTGLAHRLTERE